MIVEVQGMGFWTRVRLPSTPLYFAKERDTTGHSFRVAKYAGMIAGKMGYDENAADNVYNIGLLHDIGKITIPAIS